MKSKFFVLILATFLVACTSKPEVVKPVTVKDFVIVDPDPVPPLALDNPQWQVWNSKQLAENAAKPENTDSVFYVLPQTEFTKLMNNLVEISDRLSRYRVNTNYYDTRIKEYRNSKETK
jgi:hypothetical protein